jgi:hypothetical protein
LRRQRVGVGDVERRDIAGIRHKRTLRDDESRIGRDVTAPEFVEIGAAMRAPRANRRSEWRSLGLKPVRENPKSPRVKARARAINRYRQPKLRCRFAFLSMKMCTRSGGVLVFGPMGLRNSWRHRDAATFVPSAIPMDCVRAHAGWEACPCHTAAKTFAKPNASSSALINVTGSLRRAGRPNEPERARAPRTRFGPPCRS